MFPSPKELVWSKEVRRETSINTIVVGVGTSAPVQVLGPNPKRKAIILTPATATTQTFGWQPNVTSGQGMTLGTTNNPVVLTDEQIGSGITLPLYCIASTSGRTITFYEIVYQDSGDNRFDSEHMP